MNECQDRQRDRYIPPMWTSTKHPSVCVAFIVLDRGRAMNSARQQCLFPVYFSRDRKGTWHWIKRASLHLIFHSILVPARNPYLLFMSWLSYGGCLFYSMSFVGPPELKSTVLKHRHSLVQQFNRRLESLRPEHIQWLTKIRKYSLENFWNVYYTAYDMFFLIKCEYFVSEKSVWCYVWRCLRQ